MSSERSGRAVAFATLGVLNLTQELAASVLTDVEDAQPDLVAEETLCLVSTVTSRAAAVGLRGADGLTAAIVPVLRDLPYVYRDYLVGVEMVERSDPSVAQAADEVYQRLHRKQEFYRVHFPEHQFPGEKALTDKMALWMGRISPPKLPELPTERLSKLDLVDPLLLHLKLVLSYCKKTVDR